MPEHKHQPQKTDKPSRTMPLQDDERDIQVQTSHHIDSELSSSLPPQQMINHVMRMQSTLGNADTLRLLARQPHVTSQVKSKFSGLGEQSPVIQRKPPSSVEEAMTISKSASSSFPTTKPKQSNDVLSSLRIQAQEGFDDLKAVTDTIAGKTGGTASYRNKLKGMDRSWDKVVNKYKSDASGLIDIIASKIVYKDFKGIYAAIDMLVTSSPIQIVYFADRFLTPVASGYSDIIMSVKLPNGHIAELRLHLASVDAIFEKEHRLYEIIRSKGMDALTPEQKKEYQELKGDYDNAREEAFKSLG